MKCLFFNILTILTLALFSNLSARKFGIYNNAGGKHDPETTGAGYSLQFEAKKKDNSILKFVLRFSEGVILDTNDIKELKFYTYGAVRSWFAFSYNVDLNAIANIPENTSVILAIEVDSVVSTSYNQKLIKNENKEISDHLYSLIIPIGWPITLKNPIDVFVEASRRAIASNDPTKNTLESCRLILGVGTDFNKDELNLKYRAMSLRWHPDKYKSIPKEIKNRIPGANDKEKIQFMTDVFKILDGCYRKLLEELNK